MEAKTPLVRAAPAEDGRLTQQVRRVPHGRCTPVGAALGRGTVLKTTAALIVFLFISTGFASQFHNSPMEARTAAGGSLFSSPVMVNDNTAGEQVVPAIVSVSGSELFAVWEDSRYSISWGAIYSSRSFNNGTTWTPNKRVDDPLFNSSKPHDPAIAVSKNGTILVAWQDNRRNTLDYDIFFAKSFDGGGTFKKNVKVDDSTTSPSSWQERPSIAVTLSGIIYVAWTDDRSGSIRVRGAYSTDMGATFSASKEIGPVGSSGQTDACVAANGNRIFVAFMDNVGGVNHPYVSITSDGGKTFTAPTRLDNTGSPGKAQNGVTIAPMPAGGVIATWADTRNGDSDIYASVVGSDGKLTMSNMRIENDSSYNYNFQEAAYVTTDALGNAYAAWQDERTTGYPAVRFAVLKVGRSQFGASVEVARPGYQDMQLRPALAVRDPGRVVVMWQDDKAGTSDVYTSAGFVPYLYDLALAPGWNFVSMFLLNSSYKASTLGLAKGDMVAQWNSSRGVYDMQYIVGISQPVVDFSIRSSTGYWIYTKAAEVLSLNGTVPTSKQSRALAGPSGGGGYWAAVGFVALNASRRASDIPAMYNVTGGVTSVASYNPATGKYSMYVVGLPSTDFKIIPGQAYWCWCVKSGTLSYYP